MPNRPLPRNLRLMPQTDEEKKPELKHEHVPPIPEWLNSDVAPHWDEVAAAMVAEGLWRPCFERTLATYVSLLSVFLKDPAGFSPTKLTQLRLLAGDLGLTPSHYHRVFRTPK